MLASSRSDSSRVMPLLLPLLLGLGLASPVGAQTILPDKDRDAVVQKVREKFRPLGEAKNAAGKTFQSVHGGDYAVDEGGRAAAGAAVGKKEAAQARTEL